jgi:hypothetical protein
LRDGLTAAKAAGAGRLVMGAFLREGGRLTVSANVFDVATGRLIRPVAAPPVGTDSISAVYRRLAPKVLDLPPPLGTTLTGVGTLSTEALRSYDLGMRALNRGRTDSAKAHFARATTLDSTFALAHAGLALASRSYPLDTAIVTRAVSAATRFAATLPDRERMLIALSQPAVDPAVRCQYGRQLLARDSADAAGWLAMGQCYAQNPRLVTDASGRLHREMSLNTARDAFERVLGLQQNRDAILQLRYLLVEWNIEGCVVVTPPQCPPDSRYWAAACTRTTR